MKKGFTLIELLVVIAIIAILAAILFPVFSSAKAAAKQTADLSNVRQISTALHLYALDNDDRSVVMDHEAGYEWFEPLHEYVKSRDLFRTPAYKAAADAPESDYVLNGLFAHGAPLTKFSEPARQIVIGVRNERYGEIDYHGWPEDGASWEDLSMYTEDGEDKFTEAIQTNAFRKGGNFGFLDGHAGWFRWERTLAGTLPGMHNVDRIVGEEE